MTTRFILNGEEQATASDPMTPLVDVLRDEFFLTGAKAVCREGFCGACTVHIDGRPAVACLVPVGTVAGSDVRTVEALAVGGEPSALQRILQDHDVVQCGMCFPGIVMTLTGFFRDRPNAERDEIKSALVGNLCRCTGYERVVDAAVALARRSGR
jgi:carbon-monoxide dehydrogenase small subunit